VGERPQWDYWLYEDLGDHRKLTIYHEREFEEGDWRNKKYELDVKKWCRKSFWTPDEATLISFFRDPEKLQKAEDFVPWNEEDEEFQKHIELKKHLFDLHGLIKDSQEKKILPDFFRPEMYIDWAKRVGVSICADIPRELERAERQRNYRGPPPNIFQRASGNWPTDDMLSDSEDALIESEDAPNRKLTSQEARLKQNLIKILFAVLLESNLIKRDPVELSKKLADTLEKHKRKQRDGERPLGAQTIQIRLEEAHELQK
jgi:hypothetical protein